MKSLTEERLLEILQDRECCEFCPDGGDDAVCVKCEKVKGILADELRAYYAELTELIRAKQDGRVVVLPCKVGDSVFTLLSPPHYKRGVIYEYKVVFVGINDSKDMGYGLFNVKSVKGDWMYSFNFSDIGKTVFLTHAEAEAAMGVERE